MGRYVCIWFRHLITDWFSIRNPEYKSLPFVVRSFERGRAMVTDLNANAESKGLRKGMSLADAQAFIPDLEIRDDQPEVPLKLLKRLAEWSIRFTPVVGVDAPDGLIFDATGCTHLWGGEEVYLQDITNKFTARGYLVRGAMADSIGVAWAVARFAKSPGIVPPGNNLETILTLPPEALRIDPVISERLHKLGLHQIQSFIRISRASLRKRFGVTLINRIDMALGQAMEIIEPVNPVEPYQERLPCLEPVIHLKGIEIALYSLLQMVCLRLKNEQKGLRSAIFKGYRTDGKVVQTSIGTSRPTHHVEHVFKLFELNLSTLDPALGIELFTLEATKIEELPDQQEKLWESGSALEDAKIAELLDRVSTKIGAECAYRFFPDEHYWPERSIRKVNSLQEKMATYWLSDKVRPVLILPQPEYIEVTAPIPDYPPMLFRYKGKIHKIIKADGPERIEQEWWIREGQHRDYYRVEDDEGVRYWLFRLGHYDDHSFKWFIHGFFA